MINTNKMQDYQQKYRLKYKTKLKEWKHKYYIQNQETIKAKSRKYHHNNKEKIAERKHEYYTKNKEKLNLRSHEYYLKNNQKLHVQAIYALGGMCAICSFDDIRALQIDHINGDGADERRNTHADAFHKDIIAGGRSDLQVLCANCNWIKRGEMREHIMESRYARKQS